MPPLGSAERAHAYKWLAWLDNTVQATLILYFYPERWADDAAAPRRSRRTPKRRSARCSTSSTPSSRAHGRPWLLGDAFSLADPYALVLCRWTRGFARPARSLPHLRPFLDRMLARPSVQRVFAKEGLKEPWI